MVMKHPRDLPVPSKNTVLKSSQAITCFPAPKQTCRNPETHPQLHEQTVDSTNKASTGTTQDRPVHQRALPSGAIIETRMKRSAHGIRSIYCLIRVYFFDEVRSHAHHLSFFASTLINLYVFYSVRSCLYQILSILLRSY